MNSEDDQMIKTKDTIILLSFVIEEILHHGSKYPFVSAKPVSDLTKSSIEIFSVDILDKS